jgi:hypothetical protein
MDLGVQSAERDGVGIVDGRIGDTSRPQRVVERDEAPAPQ